MLGHKIKELRKERNLTQKQLANALGLTFQAISLWETDKADPDLTNIKILAKFFDITIDELMDMDTYDYVFEYNYKNTKLIHKEKSK